MVEEEITVRMRQKGISRTDVINELLNGANRGAINAEKLVLEAQEALRKLGDEDVDEIGRLKTMIAVEGRIVSQEHHRIGILKQIAKEDTAQP